MVFLLKITKQLESSLTPELKQERLPCTHLIRARNQSSWNHPPLHGRRQATRSTVIVAEAAGPRACWATGSSSAVGKCRRRSRRSNSPNCRTRKKRILLRGTKPLAQQRFTSTKKKKVTKLELTAQTHQGEPQPERARYQSQAQHAAPRQQTPLHSAVYQPQLAQRKQLHQWMKRQMPSFLTSKAAGAFLSFFFPQNRTLIIGQKHSTASFNLRRTEQFRTACYKPRQFWQP